MLLKWLVRLQVRSFYVFMRLHYGCRRCINRGMRRSLSATWLHDATTLVFPVQNDGFSDVPCNTISPSRSPLFSTVPSLPSRGRWAGWQRRCRRNNIACRDGRIFRAMATRRHRLRQRQRRDRTTGSGRSSLRYSRGSMLK